MNVEKVSDFILYHTKTWNKEIINSTSFFLYKLTGKYVSNFFSSIQSFGCERFIKKCFPTLLTHYLKRLFN